MPPVLSPISVRSPIHKSPFLIAVGAGGESKSSTRGPRAPVMTSVHHRQLKLQYNNALCSPSNSERVTLETTSHVICLWMCVCVYRMTILQIENWTWTSPRGDFKIQLLSFTCAIMSTVDEMKCEAWNNKGNFRNRVVSHTLSNITNQNVMIPNCQGSKWNPFNNFDSSDIGINLHTLAIECVLLIWLIDCGS